MFSAGFIFLFQLIYLMTVITHPSIIKNNIGGTNGGGICLNENSNSLIDRVVLKSNSAEAGGGLYSFNSNPIITNSAIQNNHSINGAGIFLELCSPNIENVNVTESIELAFTDETIGVTKAITKNANLISEALSKKSAKKGSKIDVLGGLGGFWRALGGPLRPLKGSWRFP